MYKRQDPVPSQRRIDRRLALLVDLSGKISEDNGNKRICHDKAQNIAGRRVDGQHDRLSSGRVIFDAADLRDQVLLQKSRCLACDGRGCQVKLPSQLRPGDRPFLSDRVQEDPDIILFHRAIIDLFHRMLLHFIPLLLLYHTAPKMEVRETPF